MERQPGIIPIMGSSDARQVVYGMTGHLYFTNTEKSRGWVSNEYWQAMMTIYPFTKATDDPDPGVFASPGPDMYIYEHAFTGVRGNTTYLAGLGYVDRVRNW